MESNVEFAQHGLKCDNPSCDWKDESIHMDDYKAWLNKPCPKCGENVLTEEDYQNALVLKAMVGMLNSLSTEEIKLLSGKAGNSDNALKDVPGCEHLGPEDRVIMSFDVHKGIKLTEIKPAANDSTE